MIDQELGAEPSGSGVWIGPGERELGEQMLAADQEPIRLLILESWSMLVDGSTSVTEAADLLGLPGPARGYDGFICS